MEKVDPMAIRKNIAMLIRSRRQAMGLDQIDLSALTGISQGALSRYETALAGMRAEDVPRLAEALKVSPLDFFEISVLDGTGMNWRPMESALIANFRALTPVERLQTAHEVQAKLMAREMKAVGLEPPSGPSDTLERLSKMRQHEENGLLTDDSGLVSKNEDVEGCETPHNVL